MKFPAIRVCVVMACLGLGCRQSAPSPAPAPPAPASNAGQIYLNHAQPKLTTVKVWLGTNELETEVAVTMQQLATGMMYRTNLAENAAMIFVFPQPHQTSFYMRNTLLPLSGAYVDPDGVILEIHDLKPKDETPVLADTDQVQYVLEVNQGWFGRHNVATGAVLRTQFGSLRETFFRAR